MNILHLIPMWDMFHNKRLVVILMIMAGSSTLISQQSTSILQVHASESSRYELDYDRGCQDALSESDELVPSLDDDEFMNGYIKGLMSCGDGGGSDDRQTPPAEEGSAGPSEPSQSGGINYVQLCSDLEVALVSSCDVLVNPDNTLTTEGERAVGCIRNGILLAGGGTLLLALPLPLIAGALQALEEPTGCGGIVEWGLIGNVGDLRGIIDRLT